MTWNYRIIKHQEEKRAYYAIHEVLYDDKERITSWTENPIDVIGDNKNDIMSILKQMTSDCKTPVLNEAELLKTLKQG
jgi:hypothetical protein